jgi:hypothetical protein
LYHGIFEEPSFSGAFSALFIFFKFHISSYLGAINFPRVITAKKRIWVFPKDLKNERRERDRNYEKGEIESRAAERKR